MLAIKTLKKSSLVNNMFSVDLGGQTYALLFIYDLFFGGFLCFACAPFRRELKNGSTNFLSLDSWTDTMGGGTLV